MCVIVAKEQDLGVPWVCELIRLCPRVGDQRLEAGHVDITVLVAVRSWSDEAHLYLFHRGGISHIESATGQLLRPPPDWLTAMVSQWPGRALRRDDCQSSEELLRVEVGAERLRARPYEINFENRQAASVWPEPDTDDQKSIQDRYGGDVPYTVIRMCGFAAGHDHVLALRFHASPYTIQTAEDELFYPVMGPFRFRRWAKERIRATGVKDDVWSNFDPALWREEHPVTDVALVGMPHGVSYHPIGGTELLRKVFPATWMDGYEGNPGPLTPVSATTYAFSAEPEPDKLDFEFWMAARLKAAPPAFVRWLDAAVSAIQHEVSGAILKRLAERGPATASALQNEFPQKDVDDALRNLLEAGLIIEETSDAGRVLCLSLAGKHAAMPFVSGTRKPGSQ